MSITIHDEFQIEALAARLAESVCKERRERQSPFHTPVILVPNLNVKTWLSLQVARWVPTAQAGSADIPTSSQIAINLDIRFFEAGLWDTLVELENAQDLSPKSKAPPVRIRLTREVLQWMIIATLMAEPEKSPLSPLLRYVGAERNPNDRQYARKLWQVADKLARLFREYEFHRPEMVRFWLSNKKPDELFEDDSPMFACQRALYRGLFGAGGLRDSLAQSDENKRTYYSLPQLADSLLSRGKLNWERFKPRGVIRIFIPPQLSPCFKTLLQQLAAHLDLEIYNFSTTVAAAKPERCALNEQWGKAGRVKSEWLQLLKPRPIGKTKLLDAPPTVLGRVQQELLAAKLTPAKVAQDSSIQIAACPSIRREVETVCNSVIHKMVTEPDLKLSDIAILVPDMAAYKPILESVLNRKPQMLSYNLVDATAADDSVYAQAVTAFLKLAEGDFVRREVFELILNPCFLSAHGMQREDALVWLQWANKLNIFRKFKLPDDSQATPFSWQSGLRRLRLGRLMEAPEDDADEQAFFDYQKVVPFSDMESESPQEVGRFSLAIESLADAASQLSAEAHGVEKWCSILRGAFESLLKIPIDRTEELFVQSTLFQALSEFKVFDKLVAKTFERANRSPPEAIAGLPMIQEFVRDNLASVPSRVGHYLLDGVTIGALKPERPLPFKVVYVMGLGEGQFPGSDLDNALDIRNEGPLQISDVSASDAAKQCFLETVLSSRSQLYLSYVARNLQKDEKYQPCSVINELKTYLAEHVLADPKFKETDVPLRGASEKYLLENTGNSTSWTDLLARNYWPADNLAALSDLLANLESRADLGERARKALKKFGPKIKQARRKLAFTHQNEQPKSTAALAENRVTLDDLKNFLMNPVEASLRRHLKLFDETEEDWALAEDEPFSTHFPLDYGLVTGVFKELIRNAETLGERQKMEASAHEFLRGTFAQSALCGDVPPGAFGELDKARFDTQIKQALSPDAKGAPGLADFLCAKSRKALGGIVIGDKRSNETHALTFPPLLLTLGEDAAQVALHGDFPFIWKNDAEGILELLVLAPKSSRDKKGRLNKHALKPFLFYLAMQAGSDADAGGKSSEKWWGDRALRVWVSYKDGLQAWDYERVAPVDAKNYLQVLTSELISSPTFDLLPFDAVCSLKPAPEELESAAPIPEDYASDLQEKIDESADSDFPAYRAPAFLELANPRVPIDALAKVVRRIGPVFKAAPIDAAKGREGGGDE